MAWGTSKRGLADLAAKLRASEDGSETKSSVMSSGLGSSASSSSVLRSLCILKSRNMSDGFDSFCEALAANTTLEELIASGHSLTPAQLAAMGSAVAQNTTLKVRRSACHG